MSFYFRPLVCTSSWHVSTLQRTTRHWFPRRTLSSTESKRDLPPESEWRKYFPPVLRVNHRVSIRNAETAAKLADAFIPEGSEGKVIIEAFPGPGQLSRALLNLPKNRIKKMIILEDWEPYLEYLTPLKEDPRVTIVNRDGYNWDTYQLIKDLGLLDDVAQLEWNQGVHPHLHFISHLPSTVTGEQLISQLLRMVPEHEWLFQWGRVPLSFILSDHVFKRVTSGINETATRCKVSIIAEASATITQALPFSALQPYDTHFHPVTPTGGMSPDLKRSSRAVGLPFHSMNVVPLERPHIEKGLTDAWDYVLRHLFVRKATELKSALPGLAPGAQTLLKKVTDPALPEDQRIDPKKKINKLEAHEWAVLLKAFDEWPFKPELKELEKLGPKMKGIVSQSVKEVLQSLVDDGLVQGDKIGSSNFFWSFPSQQGAMIQGRLSSARETRDNLQAQLSEIKESIKTERAARPESESRTQALVQLSALRKQAVGLENELSAYGDCDPAKIEEKKRAVFLAKEAALRWTDNYGTLLSYFTRQNGVDPAEVRKFLDIDEEYEGIC
ncbi:hypothetical protein H0H81_009631 [Sphagnurus paluster]|uniref:rRNA adenine N(6)-methyltransferase n=1 Tax=Sphagnurus paluster TaxID=117069 RepID=A0A9P7GIC6_9AGAR|nr:hypothetical protein H0H81_009631 [Sphagnurus paluster]